MLGCSFLVSGGDGGRMDGRVNSDTKRLEDIRRILTMERMNIMV